MPDRESITLFSTWTTACGHLAPPTCPAAQACPELHGDGVEQAEHTLMELLVGLHQLAHGEACEEDPRARRKEVGFPLVPL